MGADGDNDALDLLHAQLAQGLWVSGIGRNALREVGSFFAHALFAGIDAEDLNAIGHQLMSKRRTKSA